MKRTQRQFILFLTLLAGFFVCGATFAQAQSPALAPLLKPGEPVSWWFMFKLNVSLFPKCNAVIVCPFGGDPGTYQYGLQFVYASSANHNLVKGTGCAGEGVNDPLGATYDEIYNGNYSYVVWNDQFYDNPHLDCADSQGNCQIPWGHSKGMLAWDDNGNGVVLQVTTPDWPGSGSASHPRKIVSGEGNGNTLGCTGDDNVKFSQHFFALQLTKDDVATVLRALANASVATSTNFHETVDTSHGPQDLKDLAGALGNLSDSATPTDDTLSSGVVLISKPGKLHVPPWQMVSSLLGGVPLRAATWWGQPNAIPTTSSSKAPACWSDSLATAPGPVDIATSGQWGDVVFSLKEGPSPNGNHAKIGVSTGPDVSYAIFGDMNQQGALSGNCGASQNARGGLFFAVKDAALRQSVAMLISGDSAPTHITAPTHKRNPARKTRLKRPKET